MPVSTLTTSTEYLERDRTLQTGDQRDRAPSLTAASVAAVLLVAPLAFGAVETWCWAALCAVVGLVLILWSITSTRRDCVDLVWSPLYVPLALLAGVGLFQLARHITVDSISTRNALVELAACAALFFLVQQLAASLGREGWRAWGLIVLVYSFSIALYAIIQYLASPKQIYWVLKPQSESWIFGPYVNHNHYAGLMEMLIPVATGYVLSRRQQPLTPLLAFAVLVPVSSVFLSGSRGGVVALFLEAVLFIGVLFLRAPKDLQRHRTAGVTFALAIAFIGFLWMQPGGLVKRLETILEPSLSADVSFKDRAEVGLDSLRLFRQHVWIGTGLGSFQYAYPAYQTISTDAVWEHAHDDFIELLTDTGVVGGILAAVAIILWCRFAFRNLRERLKHRTGWIQLGAAIGCCGLLAHSLVDFNLHIPANAMWFAACAAIGISVPANSPELLGEVPLRNGSQIPRKAPFHGTDDCRHEPDLNF